MPWISGVKSVLEMWFSGEEGGTSTARLLLGLADPSGHTDITWPANATDTIWGYNETVPLYPGDTTGPHLERLNGGTGGTTDETEGIYNGYRFFDKEGITPLFPFGYGLSYTQFAYSGLHVRRAADGGLDVDLRVTNTGQLAGSTVPQVYLGAPDQQPAGIQFAVRQLAAFGRVTLQPGQSTVVSMHVPLRQLQYWSSAQQQWITAAGTRTVYAGDADSLSSLPLRAQVTHPVVGQPHLRRHAAQRRHGAGQRGRAAGCLVRHGRHLGGRQRVAGGTGLRIADSTIGGNLVAVGVRDADDPLSSGANVVCGTTIGGDLVVARRAAVRAVEPRAVRRQHGQGQHVTGTARPDAGRAPTAQPPASPGRRGGSPSRGGRGRRPAGPRGRGAARARLRRGPRSAPERLRHPAAGLPEPGQHRARRPVQRPPRHRLVLRAGRAVHRESRDTVLRECTAGAGVRRAERGEQPDHRLRAADLLPVQLRQAGVGAGRGHAWPASCTGTRSPTSAGRPARRPAWTRCCRAGSCRCPALTAAQRRSARRPR